MKKKHGERMFWVGMIFIIYMLAFGALKLSYGQEAGPTKEAAKAKEAEVTTVDKKAIQDRIDNLTKTLDLLDNYIGLLEDKDNLKQAKENKQAVKGAISVLNSLLK